MSDETTAYRIERDSMGEVRVPASALYAAQTERARQNFPISGRGLPPEFIHALGHIKAAAALVNRELGLLDERRAQAIVQAAEEVASGRWDAEFVVDVFQTGSGTSTNMNANEVIASRATLILGGELGSKLVHPNDHVNMGQSSNDVFPTAIHVSALAAVDRDLLPALRELSRSLWQKAEAFDDVVKIGRTHLQDATPIRLGQEFSGYASMVDHAIARIEAAAKGLEELAIGGTAVGTGINTHPEFGRRVAERLSQRLGLPFREADNHFEAQGAKDAAVHLSGTLRGLAVSLMKIGNDIRWLASGPRCGIGEIRLPETQPGSSIMPGKVNPVIVESLLMVCAQVIGYDATIAVCGQHGNFELNVMMPVLAWDLLDGIHLLANAVRNFTRRCVDGIEADRDRCFDLIEESLAMCTVLAPEIGYDRAAAIAKEAYRTGRTVREVAREQKVLPPEELDRLLDPMRQTMPTRA
jgi:fumarate hydratase class II